MRQHFLNDDIAFEMRALVAAVFFRPGHADPALGADLAGKGFGNRERRPLAVGRERAGLDLLAQEGAHLLPQFLCFGRQVDRVEMKIVGHRRLAILSLGALRQERPELLGALLGDQLAEPPGPQRLVAELLAPGP